MLVLKKIPDAKLIIGIGDERIIKSLEDEFTKRGILNTVKFTGFIERSEDVYKILKTGKIFVFPSCEEGWGIAIFEAIICGLSPVVYDLPIYREIFKDSIKTVPIGNFTIFAKEIINFLSNENLRKKYVLNLNTNVNIYDWNTISERELQEIKKISGLWF